MRVLMSRVSSTSAKAHRIPCRRGVLRAVDRPVRQSRGVRVGSVLATQGQSRQTHCSRRVNRSGAVSILESVTMIGGPPGTGDDLDSLFRAHATQLLRLAIALTGDEPLAEELVQDAFLGLARQPSSPRVGAEFAYLRRAVVNGSHGHHRHLAVVRRHPVEPPNDVPAADANAGRRDAQRRVADAVRDLPARQRDCMVLRCYAEATDAEIADTLGVSVGSVKSHLHRARATLARQLEDLR